MITIKNMHNGTITISDIIDGQWVKQIYDGYTLAEAKAKFREYVKSLKEAK